MSVRRTIGSVLLFVALMILGAEFLRALENGSYTVLALGEIWYQTDSDSLNLLQAVVERYIHPFLWYPIITTMLFLPGWLLPGALGGLLIYSARRRKRIFARRRAHPAG